MQQDACIMSLLVNSIFAAKHIPINFNADRINAHRNRFSNSYTYCDAQLLLQFSLMVTNANLARKALELPDWLQHHAIQYDACPGASLAHVVYNQEKNILFIIFTGTASKCLAQLDLDYEQIELESIMNYIPGLRGHKGIYNSYRAVRPLLLQILSRYLNTNTQLVITGHSLGGGLSQICTLDLAYYAPIHYSFAAPLIFNRVGYEAFSKFVRYSYRIANLSDLVVLCPLPVMSNKNAFYHVGQLIYFQRNYGVYLSNHLHAYIEEFDLQRNIIVYER